MKPTLSVNGPPYPVEKIKPRSRNKFGMTASIALGFRDGSTPCVHETPARDPSCWAFLLATWISELTTDFKGGKHGRIRKKIEGKNDRQEYD